MKREIDDELQFHLEQRTAQNIAAGMSPEDAAREARKRFGNVQSVREECRDRKGASFGETVWQDVRFGLHMLRRNPGFTAVAVLTLALGIGANTAVFTLINGLLLRPLPFKSPDRLVRFQMRNTGSGLTADGTSYLNFEDWRNQNAVFEEMAAVFDTTFTLAGNEGAERLHGLEVSDRFFALMGVAPVRGRVFGVESATDTEVAVVSQRLFQRRFGGQTDVQGKLLTLDGKTYSIIGIMPAAFNLSGDPTDVWIPMKSSLKKIRRGNQYLITFARLKDGIDLRQAQSDMGVIAARLARQFPDDDAGWSVMVRPLPEMITGPFRHALLITFGCVGLVLLIVCLNIGQLAMARGAARSREIAMRVALGASRSRIVRQFMVESLMLSLLGGTLGLAMALVGMRLLQTAPLTETSSLLAGLQAVPLEAMRVDGPVLVFLLLTSLIAGVFFGLLPALRFSRSDPNQMLKENAAGSGGTAGRRDRFHSGFLVAQIAASLVLLVAAGLLVGSLMRLTRVDPGFRAENVIFGAVSLSSSDYSRMPRVTAFWDQLCERVAAFPEVDSAGAVNIVPFSANNMTEFTIEGQSTGYNRVTGAVNYRVATPNYFRAMGIPLLAGRDIGSEDSADARGVVVIDDVMARQFWPGKSPIGATIHVNGRARSVVGVVGAVRQFGLDSGVSSALYLPLKQEPVRELTLVVRTKSDSARLGGAIRAAVKETDPSQAIAGIRLMKDVVAASVGDRQMMACGLGGFAGLALLLVAIGLYGSVSLSVAGRTREIGVRMALGASRQQVLRLVIRQGVSLALAGVGIGVVLAFALSRAMSSLLYEVRPTDVPTFLSVSCLLVAVSFLACWLPARRAANVDPMVALRCE